MAKQLTVGQTHRLDGVGEWASSNPECVAIHTLNDAAGKQDSADVMANAVTPEQEPAVITLNGEVVLRVNVVPAAPPSEPAPSE